MITKEYKKECTKVATSLLEWVNEDITDELVRLTLARAILVSDEKKEIKFLIKAHNHFSYPEDKIDKKEYLKEVCPIDKD